MNPTYATLPTDAPPSTDNPVREGVLVLPGRFPLAHGGHLDDPRVAWRLAGAPGLPVVLALGGISASRHVFGQHQGTQGWWHAIVGPGLPLDTRRLAILGIDFLGGSHASTGPRSGETFPAISSTDQAHAAHAVLAHLGIAQLRAVVGASYGGMVALAFGSLYPQEASRLVVISAADAPHPMATAWRSVQRAAIRLGMRCGEPAEGVQLARALAMATYRSSAEFSVRFAGEPVLQQGRFVFPVEEYLYSRGRDYAARTVPESYLCLSESIDLHRVDARCISVPTDIVAVREDQLVPVDDLRELARRLPHSTLHEISSVYGHDAFLKETEQLRPILAPLAQPAFPETDAHD